MYQITKLYKKKKQLSNLEQILNRHKNSTLRFAIISAVTNILDSNLSKTHAKISLIIIRRIAERMSDAKIDEKANPDEF